MWRAILSVIAGYLAMFLFVFVSFSAAYLTMGTEGAFQPGSYEVSGLWLAVSFVLSLGAAVGGGVGIQSDRVPRPDVYGVTAL